MPLWLLSSIFRIHFVTLLLVLLKISWISFALIVRFFIILCNYITTASSRESGSAHAIAQFIFMPEYRPLQVPFAHSSNITHSSFSIINSIFSCNHSHYDWVDGRDGFTKKNFSRKTGSLDRLDLVEGYLTHVEWLYHVRDEKYIFSVENWIKYLIFDDILVQSRRSLRIEINETEFSCDFRFFFCTSHLTLFRICYVLLMNSYGKICHQSWESREISSR